MRPWILSAILLAALASIVSAEHFVNPGDCAVRLSQPLSRLGQPAAVAAGWRLIPGPYPQPPAIGEPVPPPLEVRVSGGELVSSGGDLVGTIRVHPTNRHVYFDPSPDCAPAPEPAVVRLRGRLAARREAWVAARFHSWLEQRRAADPSSVSTAELELSAIHRDATALSVPEAP